MKKKILVFGGNKFLGKKIIEEAKAKIPDCEITSVTRSGTDLEGIKSIVCDRTDKQALEKIFSGSSSDNQLDIVFDVSSYKLETLQPSLDVLKDKVKTWAFVSSAGVYAKSKAFPIQSHFAKVSEASAHYGKYACEEALRKVAETNTNFNTFCIRPFYIYGPENTFDRETFFFRAIEEEQEILIPDDGQALLQFASVKDTASVFVNLALLPTEKTQNGIFHPCDKSVYSLNSIMEICGEVLGKKPKIKHFSGKEAAKMSVTTREIFPLRAEHYFGDIEPLNGLGIKTSDDLYAGLKETYEWFKNNRDKYPSYSLMPAAEKLMALH